MTTALISIYYPPASVREHVKEISSQVDAVYLCDNSPNSNHSMFVGSDMPNNIHYMCNYENLGISAAFNRVLKNPDLGWKDEDFVFFFDQDSVIKKGHVQNLLSVYHTAREKGVNVGCLGCVYYNTSHGAVEIPRLKKKLFEGTYAVSSIITSSMLSTYGNLKSVNFWNEHVFLDMADWDLCWRLKASGKECCLTEAVVLRHSIGSAEKKLGPIKLRVGRPVREYYQIRECLYLLSRPYTPLKYRIRFLAMLLVRSPLHILLLDRGKQRVRYICRGILDFFRNKQGVIDSEFQKKIDSL